MSDQVTTAAAENKNQAATEANKTAATEATSTTVNAVTEANANAATTTTSETPKPEDKGAAPATEPVFEIKKADGSLVDAAEAEKIVSFSKEHGLSPAQAQAIYARESAAKSAFDADVAKQYEERKNGWIETVKKDPVMGGENFTQNVQAAHLALQKFATPEFTKLLDETGFGNHPELLRVFFNIHQAHKDDTFVRQGEAPAALKSTAEVMYGESNKK